MTLDELRRWVNAALRNNEKDTEVVCRLGEDEYFSTFGFISKTGSVEVDNISDFGEEEKQATVIHVFEKEN